MKNVAMIAVAAVAGLASAKGNTNGLIEVGRMTTLTGSGVAVTATGYRDATRSTPNGFVTLTLENGASAGDPGDPVNTAAAINLASIFGAAVTSVTGTGWDVSITTLGGSWLSEAGYSLAGQSDLGIFVTPFAGATFNRPSVGEESTSSGGIIDYTDNALPDTILDNSILLFELFESFDDALIGGGLPSGEDAFWNGTITVAVTVVPAPGAGAVLAAAGVLAARRRRA